MTKQYFATIRVKLTILYSLIVFILCGLLVLALNIYLISYLQADPMLKDPPARLFIQQIDRNRIVIDDFNNLQSTERERIRNIRLNDLIQIQNLSLLSLLPIAFISFILEYIVSGSFLKPIDDLKHNIDNLTQNDLGKTIPVEVEDEVGGLIKSFNELSSRLKTSFDDQERFVQDASHELKTPLTIIQTNLDTIIDDPNATKEELLQAINKSLVGVKSLKKLTNYLLDLTISRQQSLKPIDLTNFIKLEKDKIDEYANKNGVTIELNLPGHNVMVSAQEISLARAIDNIIENAINYRDKNLKEQPNKVVISLCKEQDLAKIIIQDNGIGIPKGSINFIFDPFYRVEKSRNKKSGDLVWGLLLLKKSSKIIKERSLLQANLIIQSLQYYYR